MRIGFIGTGTMGTPIAGELVKAGHRLIVYDIRPEATAALAAHGAAVANSAGGACAGAEAVFTSLPGPNEMEATALDPDNGILATLGRGGTYIDLTTNKPATIRLVAAAAERRGIAFLDAPVSGRPPNMTAMVGGSDADFVRCKPLFDAIAKNVFHVGPQGAGCVAKLVTQYMGYSNFIAAVEGLVIAAKAGIDLGVLAKIVPVSAGQSRTFDTSARAVISRAFASNGSLDIIVKDLDLAVNLAREVGAPATLGALAYDAYKRAQARGLGGEGYPSVAKVLEAMAAIELNGEPRDE
jgi:3-hydroxyisobutyrate dehydrogenase-like beta-hydroxyacid dehydrogenase